MIRNQIGASDPPPRPRPGLEYFAAGSTLANQILDVRFVAAQKSDCS